MHQISHFDLDGGIIMLIGDHHTFEYTNDIQQGRCSYQYSYVTRTQYPLDNLELSYACYVSCTYHHLGGYN